MTNPERAQQFWSVLVFAAKEQKVLSYEMIGQMTGMAQIGAGQPLGYIYYYCKHHKLPLLNTLAISKETGRPTPDILKDVDLPGEQARVFVYNWLSHGVPSTQSLEDARTAEEATVAEAAAT